MSIIDVESIDAVCSDSFGYDFVPDFGTTGAISFIRWYVCFGWGSFLLGNELSTGLPCAFWFQFACNWSFHMTLVDKTLVVMISTKFCYYHAVSVWCNGQAWLELVLKLLNKQVSLNERGTVEHFEGMDGWLTVCVFRVWGHAAPVYQRREDAASLLSNFSIRGKWAVVFERRKMEASPVSSLNVL